MLKRSSADCAESAGDEAMSIGGIYDNVRE